MSPEIAPVNLRIGNPETGRIITDPVGHWVGLCWFMGSYPGHEVWYFIEVSLVGLALIIAWTAGL
jgi:hypothetical protein